MNVIHKILLPDFGEAKVKMPRDAKVLTAQIQMDAIAVWFQYNSDQKETEIRIFDVFDTGEYFKSSKYFKRKYIATVQFSLGDVRHVYERYEI